MKDSTEDVHGTLGQADVQKSAADATRLSSEIAALDATVVSLYGAVDRLTDFCACASEADWFQVG